VLAAVSQTCSGERAAVSRAEREQLHLTPDRKIAEIAAWISDLAAERQAFRERLEERQRL
jgi:hypothetical protein